MQASVLVLCLLPLAVHAVPCTDSTTEASPTTEPPPTTTTEEPTTTEYVPPPQNFPQGTYGLFRPDVGCPVLTGFKTFFRYWDTEDRYNANTWPETEHFQGYMKKDGIKMYMCTKPSATTGGDYEWPAGDYCIIKKGDCPVGFAEGQIFWDDENDINQDKRSGKMDYWPDDDFTENTRLDFCCRDDGSVNTAIKLPIRRAFYLNQYTGGCQAVAEMKVTEEVVYWDDEDVSNANTKSGAHPRDTGDSGNHKLYFCYYEPVTA